jgi:hypothetical protein
VACLFFGFQAQLDGSMRLWCMNPARRIALLFRGIVARFLFGVRVACIFLRGDELNYWFTILD